MLAPSPPLTVGPPTPDPERVRRAYANWVLPCGRDAVNRLESLLERKFALVQSFGTGEADRDALEPILRAIFSARAHREAIATHCRPHALQEIVRSAAARRLRPGAQFTVADQVAGVPRGIAEDIAAELIHAAAPDRVGLWTRWIWNPARATGVLGEFGAPGPLGAEGVQPAMGSIRLVLAGLGFPSPTFASVDILLALTHAQRLARASEKTNKAGGTKPNNQGPYANPT